MAAVLLSFLDSATSSEGYLEEERLPSLQLSLSLLTSLTHNTSSSQSSSLHSLLSGVYVLYTGIHVYTYYYACTCIYVHICTCTYMYMYVHNVQYESKNINSSTPTLITFTLPYPTFTCNFSVRSCIYTNNVIYEMFQIFTLYEIFY